MSVKKRPVFDYSLCVSCSICVQSCPVSCIVLSMQMSGNDKNLYPTAGEGCIGCMQCVRSCPMGAAKAIE